MFRVAAGAGDGDGVQRSVELAISASVQSVRSHPAGEGPDASFDSPVTEAADSGESDAPVGCPGCPVRPWLEARPAAAAACGPWSAALALQPAHDAVKAGRTNVEADPAEVNAFIAEQKAAGLAVELVRRTLGVSRSAHYERASGKRSPRRVRDDELLEQIRDLHAANYEAYG